MERNSFILFILFTYCLVFAAGCRTHKDHGNFRKELIDDINQSLNEADINYLKDQISLLSNNLDHREHGHVYKSYTLANGVTVVLSNGPITLDEEGYFRVASVFSPKNDSLRVCVSFINNRNGSLDFHSYFYQMPRPSKGTKGGVTK